MPIPIKIKNLFDSRDVLQRKLDYANALIFYAIKIDYSKTSCPFVKCLLDELQKNGTILQAELDFVHSAAPSPNLATTFSSFYLLENLPSRIQIHLDLIRCIFAPVCSGSDDADKLRERNKQVPFFPYIDDTECDLIFQDSPDFTFMTSVYPEEHKYHIWLTWLICAVRLNDADTVKTFFSKWPKCTDDLKAFSPALYAEALRLCASTGGTGGTGGGSTGGGGTGTDGDDNSGLNLGKSSKGGDITASSTAGSSNITDQSKELSALVNVLEKQQEPICKQMVQIVRDFIAAFDSKQFSKAVAIFNGNSSFFSKLHSQEVSNLPTDVMCLYREIYFKLSDLKDLADIALK